MKRITILIFLFAASLFAQNDANVLSYYSSDNSLDGQPRIDMMNVIRFFPVFAIQDSVKEVKITIYYGDKIFDANANKMAGGKYWQTLLPEFHLGDAIQRIEAKMTFNLSSNFYSSYSQLETSIDNTKIDTRDIRDLAREKNERIKNEVRKITSLPWPSVLKAYEIYNEKNILSQSNDSLKIQESLKNVFGNETFYSKLNLDDQNKFISEFSKIIMDSVKFNSLSTIDEYRNSVIVDYKNQIEKLNYLKSQKDSLTKSIFDKIVGEISDTSYSGPAIRKSDLKISVLKRTASLLYRYYKNNLRYRKALDPAEHLGIFRARYVPFPVVGMPSDNKVRLLRPMQEKVPTVFEVGLSFGDDVVSGDNTFSPALSLSRLGFAMVISEQLFKADAEILGLALTYDFNSYASIGIGRNLAQGQSYPYYSFGINKKAFEQLLKALSGLF